MTEEYAKLVQGFVDWLTAKGYKPRGIDEKARASRQYLEYLEAANGDASAATMRDAEGFREHMRMARGLDAKTINIRIAYLGLFYRYLVGAGKAVKNPFKDLERMQESERIPRNILTIEQMGKLIGAIAVANVSDFEFKTLVELLYSSGARISEIEHLKMADVDFDAGCITIRDDKSRNDRKLPLTEIARELLMLYCAHVRFGEYVFLDSPGRLLGRRVNRRLRALCAQLGLPPLSCHGIRHTTATHLLKKGADIREVQEILGHRHIKDTEAYLRIFPDDLRELIERRHPREAGKDEADR